MYMDFHKLWISLGDLSIQSSFIPLLLFQLVTTRSPLIPMTSSPILRWLTRAGGAVCAGVHTASSQPITWRFGSDGDKPRLPKTDVTPPVWARTPQDIRTTVLCSFPLPSPLPSVQQKMRGRSLSSCCLTSCLKMHFYFPDLSFKCLYVKRTVRFVFFFPHLMSTAEAAKHKFVPKIPTQRKPEDHTFIWKHLQLLSTAKIFPAAARNIASHYFSSDLALFVSVKWSFEMSSSFCSCPRIVSLLHWGGKCIELQNCSFSVSRSS